MVQTFLIGATSRFSALRWTAPGISGPYLTTGVDGVNLNMWTKLNGQFEQQGNTNVYEMVAYFSTHMVLYAGDLLATGTAPGFGKNRLMAVGDVLECGIEHLALSGTRSEHSSPSAAASSRSKSARPRGGPAGALRGRRRRARRRDRRRTAASRPAGARSPRGSGGSSRSRASETA